MAKKNIPAEDQKQFQKLSTCVYRALGDIQESEARYEQFLQWAIKGAEDLYYDVDAYVKTVELEIEPHKVIILPKDCLKVSKLGIRCGNEVHIFTVDHNLPNLFNEDDDGNKVAQKDCEESWANIPYDNEYGYYLYNFTNINGESPGRLFGRRFKDNGLGYYKVNDCEIILNPRMDMPQGQKIYLEYIANAINITEDTYIHPFAKEMIVQRIHWERMKNFPERFSQVSIDRAEDYYNQQVDKVLMRMAEWSIDDVKEASLAGYQLGPQTL
jgi:hypothetical protein